MAPNSAAKSPSTHQPVSKAELFDRLTSLGISYQTIDHPPVFTVAESSAIEAALPGAHTKNLFLKDAKGKLFLIVAENRTEINLKALPAAIGSKRLSFGKPELLLETLGVEPGSVTAFAVINDLEHRVNVILDATLTNYETVNCHPLRNDATTNIARDDLLRFIRACGHEISVVQLPE